jgi:hypothetical protein
MPDEIVAIGQIEGAGNRRLTYISSGWASLNGTYTFELNLATCLWNSVQTVSATGVHVEAWSLFQTTRCDTYVGDIDPDSMLPVLEGQHLSSVRISMSTHSAGTRFFHEFSVAVVDLGPFFSWQIESSPETEDLCNESPLVFYRVVLARGTGEGDAEFICEGDDAGASTANSYVT